MSNIDEHLRARFLSKYKIVKWFFKDQRPATLEVHTAYPCNYKCSFCIDEWLKKVPSINGVETNNDCKSMLTKKNMDDIIDGCLELKIPGIIISGGGEPTVNKNTEYLVGLSRENNIKIGMFTNGYALNDLNIPTYVSGLTFLRFSFDSFDSKNYAKTKGVSEKAYFKVLENIDKCVKYKKENNNVDCKIGIDFVIQPSSIHLITGLYNRCCELGVDYIQFCDCVTVGYQFTEKVKRQILEEIEKCMNMDKKIEIAYEPIQVQNEVTCDICKMKDFIFVIGADGGVRPCPHLARHNEMLYGNINEKSLKEIWDNRPTEKVHSFLYEYCRFRKQNEILNGLSHIEHGEIL